jgi:catechol 2,3-dioxygenase-like lactoylglutathione lyase family enzyme
VRDLDQSIAFYSALFSREPDKREADYAKWMLEDPRANIAISTRGEKTGVDHVGLQVETTEELEAIAGRLKAAGTGALEEKDATCCYARSDKYWALSPDGAKWELYRTFGESKSFGAAPSPEPIVKNCCPA